MTEFRIYIPSEEEKEEISIVAGNVIDLITQQLNEDVDKITYLLAQIVLGFQDTSGVNMIQALESSDRSFKENTGEVHGRDR